jgi:hypothetical protein
LTLATWLAKCATLVLKSNHGEIHMSVKQELSERTSLTIRRPEGTPEEQQRRRAEALKATLGLWKGRADIPSDGVEYQKQLRNEWE